MREKIIDGSLIYLSDTLTGLSAHLWSNEPYEPDFMWILKEEAEGDLALDIGANIGYSTLILCKKMKNVIAIEPDGRNRRVLIENIKLYNLCDRVTIYDYIMSNKSGVEKFYYSKHSNLSSSVRNRKYRTKVRSFPSRTIDSLGILPNFIKMDLEGYEVEVIKGGMKSLEKTNKCKILIEVHPSAYNEKRNFSKVLKKLVNIGYKFKYVVSAGYNPSFMFSEKGYSPFMSFKCGKFNRCIFKNLDSNDAINFSSKLYKKSNLNDDNKIKLVKIVRSIMMEK